MEKDVVSVSLRSAWYDRTKPVLREVALTVREGEIVTVTGPSGVGKSTLLSILAGLHTGYDGAVHVDGPVALIPQKNCLLPWYTVYENLVLPARACGVRPDRDAAAALLDELGLSALAGQYPQRLSGGEYRRAALGQALFSAPSVLLMDEPFTALDAGTKADVLSLFLRLWRKVGMTTVFVTHDHAEAAEMGGRIVRLGL